MIETPEYIAATKAAYDAMDSATTREEYSKAQDMLRIAEDSLILPIIKNILENQGENALDDSEYYLAKKYNLIA